VEYEAQLYDKTPDAKITPPYQAGQQSEFEPQIVATPLVCSLAGRALRACRRFVAQARNASRYAKLPGD